MLLFALRVTLFVLAVVAAYLTVKRFNEHIAAVIVSIALALAYIVVLIATKWTVFAIPKIILFLVVFLFAKMNHRSVSGKYFDRYFNISLIVLVLSYAIGIIAYFGNIKTVEEPVVTLTTQEIVCANDGTSTEGNIKGGGFIVWSVQGSLEEEMVYRYYYRLDNGGMKIGQVDANKATLFDLEDGKQPYIEKVEKKYYQLNYNHDPVDEYSSEIVEEYNIYIPKGSVGNVYEFDAA